MNTEYKKLYITAKQATENSYAPFSNFRVGAALLCSDGSVYSGVNIENSSLGATICAERTAFAKAISEGRRDFKAVAIASSGGTAWPCGICRQFMNEFCGGDFEIIAGEDEDSLEIRRLSELLPEGFKL